MTLDELLVDLSGFADDEQVEAEARRLYAKLYLNRDKIGLHDTHDGHRVVFHLDRFDHAFFTDPSHGRFDFARKNLLARDRIERIAWIGEIIRGRVPDSACWEVPNESGEYRPPTRLYIVYDRRYVVWLRPRKNDFPGWNFSTAFVARPSDLRGYTRGGKRVWYYQVPEKEMPRD